MRWILSLATILLLAGCGDSHIRDDDASTRVDGGGSGCAGPAPADCWDLTAEGCCSPVAPSCDDGTWTCGDRITCGPVCEGPIGCGGPPPSCHPDLGGGCCGDPIGGGAFCTGSAWACGMGTITALECTSFSPACIGGACDGLTEAGCIGDAACVPLYDDFCCPACSEVMGCADCSRPQMHRCATEGEGCGTGMVCGAASASHCGGGLPDCSAATPVSGLRCDVPGCVASLPVGCSDCEPTCVAVTGESCVAICAEVAPTCPDGYRAEADAGCWTGRCIAQTACLPAQTPGP